MLIVPQIHCRTREGENFDEVPCGTCGSEIFHEVPRGTRVGEVFHELTMVKLIPHKITLGSTFN